MKHLLERVRYIIFGVIKVILPAKITSAVFESNNDNKAKMGMNENKKSDQCSYNSLSPIKNDCNDESPWSNDVVDCIITPNTGVVKEFDYNDKEHKSKYVQPNNSNGIKNKMIKCPKCSYEIKLCDSYNLITCISPFYCRGNIKFCCKCRIIITSDNERNHFKHGYYKPICTIKHKEKKYYYIINQ